MELVVDVTEMQALADRARLEGKRIALVPTMGALHQGHMSLVKLARERCDFLVVSIYVNPAQFAPEEDLDIYPRTLEKDEEICHGAGVDVIFAPEDKTMYPERYSTYVNVEGLSEVLCGASRPTHFRGVSTIVAKLFNIVKPHIAVFGQKDAQQAVVIKRMTADLNWDIEIAVAPILREEDGLAMSSRNRHLSAQERKGAVLLHQALSEAKSLLREGERSAEKLKKRMKEIISAKALNRIDYISVVEADNLRDVSEIKGETLLALAVYAGETRLIDNMLIGADDLKSINEEGS